MKYHLNASIIIDGVKDYLCGSDYNTIENYKTLKGVINKAKILFKDKKDINNCYFQDVRIYNEQGQLLEVVKFY